MFLIRMIVLLIVLLGIGRTADVSGEEYVRSKGRYIQLTSDAISPSSADTIVATFDAAVDQWSDFWGLDAGQLREFRVEAYVVGDISRFRDEGLIPPQVPNFPFGYALNDRIWVRAQPSEYYTRHLVLHEGVHSLAYACFDGAGSTWFQEGTAELLATHRGVGQNVRINIVPENREEVPYWGRFKRMQQSRQEKTVPTLSAVLRYRPNLLGDVETYGWSWAASMMLTRYPEYRPVMMQAARDGTMGGPPFNERFRRKLASQWPILEARWRVMAHDLDYGFDWSREQLELSIQDPKWDGRPLQLKIASDRGWQSAGVRVPGGVSVQVSASGRITLADQPKPWISESTGITFEYAKGRPLGQLMIATLPNAIDPNASMVEPLNVHAVDAGPVKVDQYSWLLFRVNDHLDQLGDNRGSYSVGVTVAR